MAVPNKKILSFYLKSQTATFLKYQELQKENYIYGILLLKAICATHSKNILRFQIFVINPYIVIQNLLLLQ